MADLLQEVDEMMRQERIEKFWHENRNYIIGVIVGTILLTGIISGYRSWNNSVKEHQTATLVTMQEATDYPQNVLDAKKLNLRGGLRGIAFLQAAGAFMEQEKEDEALKLYQRTANDKGIPADFRYLGALMAAQLQIDKEDTDLEALLKTLAPALNDNKSPWQNHARIQAALVCAKLKKYDQALPLLNAVQDTQGLPETLTKRAADLARLYTLENRGTEQTGS